MKKQVIVVDILQEIVKKVEARYNSHIQFMYGPVEEIEANLIAITNSFGLPGGSAESGYPLIAVFQDFPENREGNGGYYADVTLPIVLIATLTDKNYKAPQRYENSFKPVLYPIYELFMEELSSNGAIVGTDHAHTKYDRLYYGKRTLGTAVSSYVDAIELQNLKLTVAQSC